MHRTIFKFAFLTLIAFAALALTPSTLYGQMDTVWTRYYDSSANLWPRSAQEMTDGDLVIAGQENESNITALPWVHAASILPDGELIWERRYEFAQWPGDLPPGGFACMAFPFADGSFRLIATYLEASPGGMGGIQVHPFACFIDCAPNGDTLHTELVDGLDHTFFWCAERTADGGAIIAGKSDHAFYPDNLVLTKLTPEGTVAWSIRFPYEETFIPSKIHETADGGYLIAGWHGFPGDTDVDDLSSIGYRLVRTDAAGGFMWDRLFRYQNAGGKPGVVEQPDGTILFACTVRFLGTDWNPRIFILSADGDSLGMMTYPAESFVRDLLLLHDNSLLLVCSMGQVEFRHLSPQLDVLDTQEFGGAGWDALYNFMPVASGGLIAVGSTDSWGATYTHFYAARLDETTSATSRNGAVPGSWQLSSYPNPFNPTTTISFSLPKAEALELKIFDVTGREVRTLTKGMMQEGEHHVSFNAGDLPSGIYFASLIAGSVQRTQKIVLLK